jgi:Kef-type K+ transport system membrane component KefB
VLVQLIVILTAARAGGWLFRHLGQPQVCGEIGAGLLLGPSLFGRFFPRAFASTFDSNVGPIFSMFSQVGLILLLFLVGLEFDFGQIRNLGRKALVISAAGIALPFTLGVLTARVAYPVVGAGIDERGFALFIATAMSITALPTLGRILVEFNLHRTGLGVLTITAAAADDAAGWTILASITAIVQAKFQPLRAALMVVEILVYALVMILVVRPLLLRWIQKLRGNAKLELTATSLTAILVLVLLSALTTNFIGIFSIFGGFMMGSILCDQADLRLALAQKLKDFTTVFFLPIFFTYTGLRTEIGTMRGLQMWMLLSLVLGSAVLGKFCGCASVARFAGLSWRDCCSVGVLMNTRALMELVVINIGLDFGLIPRSVFFMLVTMAVVTTYMTAPILTRLINSTDLEAPFLESEFMRNRNSLRPALQRAG